MLSGAIRSPSTPSPSRLVANTTSRGHDRSNVFTRCATGSRRCSQLSSTSNSSLWRRNSTTASSTVSAARGVTENRAATASVTPSRVADRCQLTPPGAVTELGEHLRRHLQRQPGLADPAHPGQGHGPHLTERGGHARHLALAADERAHRRRQVPHDRVQRPQRRELAHQIGLADLENRLGTTQVAQTVLTQVDQSDTLRQRVPHQRSRRGRAQDLSAMARGS